jgi:hypothetical protein
VIRFLEGLVLVAVVCVPLFRAGRRVRRACLPGSPAVAGWVADAVLALAAILAVAQVAGIVGVLDAPAVVVGCLLVAVATFRLVPGREDAPRSVARRTERGWERALALGLGAVVAADWVARTATVLERGTPGNVDTWWYHMPFAVRYAHEGSIGGLHHVFADPTIAFYPAHGSLLHATGVLLMGSDVLAPALNLVALAIGLAAGWAIGEAYGVPHRGLVAAAVVFGLPVLVVSNGGEATTDALALALVLAALAVLATGGVDRRAPIAVAGVAVGLAVGTKLSMLWVAGGLTVGLVLWIRRGGRLGLLAIWTAAATVAGGFWFVRNLVEAGNPFPFVRIPLGFVTLERPRSFHYLDGPASASALDKLGTPGFLSEVVPNDLGIQFGPLWPVLLAVAVGGLALGLARPGLPRAVAIAGVVAGTAFLATPTTGTILLGQLRHVAVVLAVAVLVLMLQLRGRAAASVAVVLTGCVVAAVVAPESGPRPSADGVVVAALVLATVGAVVTVGLRAPGLRVVVTSAAVVVAALAAGVRWHDRGGFVAGDPGTSPVLQSGFQHELVPAMRWALLRGGERIAVVNIAGQLPFHGRALDNRVQYVGVPRQHGGYDPVPTCRQWWERLTAERARYVLVADEGLESAAAPPRAPEHAWTRSAPGVRTVISRPHVKLYRLPALAKPRCGPAVRPSAVS